MRARLLLVFALIGEWLPTVIGEREVVAGLGLVLIGLGLSMVSVPAALVITGILLFLSALWPVFAARS